MMRRSLLLALVPLNDPWQRFVAAANKWSAEWNAMAQEPGTLSLGEARAWADLELAWAALRNARKEQRGKG